MSGLNAFVSNGTCYKGRGDSADDLMLPCGNAGLGHKTCCQAGDMCLSSHACFNGKFGVTYLAGCSDPDYEDGSCPDKGAFDGTFFPFLSCLRWRRSGAQYYTSRGLQR